MPDPIPLYVQDVLELPTRIHRLQFVNANSPLRAEGRTGVVDEIEDLSDALIAVGMHQVWDEVASGFGQLLFLLRRRLKAGQGSLGEENLDYLSDTVATLAKRFQCGVARKRLVAVSTLTPEVDFGLRDDLTPPLEPEITWLLVDAQRCWSVGFHLPALLITFTALERLTSYYYERTIGDPPPELHSWGMMIGDLKAGHSECRQDLLESLDGIVKEYRNPIVHGDEQVDGSGAEVIYELCARMSRQMISELVFRQDVYVVPSSSEKTTIKVAMDALAGKASVRTLSLFLGGKHTPDIDVAGWDGLPEFGAFRHLSLRHIKHKLECVKDDFLNEDDNLILGFLNTRCREDARDLAVTRLFEKANELVSTNAPDEIWPWVQRIPIGTKRRFLREICLQGIVEFAPVLRAWFPFEVKRIRTAINKCLQDMECSPIPHCQAHFG